MAKIAALSVAFPAPEYYLAESAAHDAVKDRFQFNILHPASGLKVDVIVPADTEFARSEAKRIKRITSEGEYSVWLGSPEDVLLNKLVYYRLSGGVSDKHLRDIAGMMSLPHDNLDRTYIVEWAAKLGVTVEWELVRQRVDEAKP